MKTKEKFIAFLGKDTEFEGHLTFYGTIRIDGIFKGKILASGILIVGEGGKVEANLRIPRIIILGEVQGNIIAEERIEIRVPGKVLGDILTPILLVEEGAVFDGNCWMNDQVDTFEKEWGLTSSDESSISFPSAPAPIDGAIQNNEKDEKGESLEGEEAQAVYGRNGETHVELNASGDYGINKDEYDNGQTQNMDKKKAE